MSGEEGSLTARRKRTVRHVARPITGAGPRLKATLDERGISVRSFQRQLEASGVRGAAYSSVWSYLTGKVEPPVEFLDAAAARLELRLEYLRKGTGPRTAHGATAALVQEEALARDERLVELRRFGDDGVAGLKRGFPDYATLDGPQQTALVGLWSTYWGSRHVRARRKIHTPGEAGEFVGRLLSRRLADHGVKLEELDQSKLPLLIQAEVVAEMALLAAAGDVAISSTAAASKEAPDAEA